MVVDTKPNDVSTNPGDFANFPEINPTSVQKL